MKNDNIKLEKYLGVDWGEKRIGLALGDSEIKIATPLGVANNLAQVRETVKKEGIDKIVVGQPLKMRDAKLEVDNRFLAFLSSLKKAVAVPVILIDERLSSRGADSLPGSKKNKAARDAIAAMLILQIYLDKT